MFNKIIRAWLIGAAMIHFYDMGGAEACNSEPSSPLVAKFTWPFALVPVLMNYTPAKDHSICDLYIR